MSVQLEDLSNGYEALAAEFMGMRSSIGTSTIEKWAASLPKNASVLDIGAGHGYPLTPILLRAGCKLSAIDASPSLVAAHRKNFPNVRMTCEAAEQSDFFGEKFDAVLSVGVMFLLPEKTQASLIPRIAEALKPKGRFLFSAPKQKCEWIDNLTRQTSRSLGAGAYESQLTQCGLTLIATHRDSGGNYYFDAETREF